MYFFDLIKRGIAKIFQRAEKDPLQAYNKTSTNKVFSSNVNLKSLKGSFIQVRENTAIDESSSIQSYTYIGANTNITKATIGRYCSIANNVSIGPGEHDLTAISTSSIFYEAEFENLTRGICEIGNDVWIGVDSIIKRGVTIGNGAVVGANSFVTKDVPCFAIVAGNPAKLIRHRFNEYSANLIIESGWWNHELEEAKLILQTLKIKLDAPV